jgi:predicted alpha/beta-fold hydrolase
LLVVNGHFWTLAGHFSRNWASAPVPAAAHAMFEVQDARLGSVTLTARLSVPQGAQQVLILIHGLGGSSQSPYLAQATGLAHQRGLATLRLNLRGADLRGEDFYHAGLSSDLHDVVASQLLSGYSQIFLLGYSLGGHVSLRFASETCDERVKRIATLCAPLDLDRGAHCFDSARAAIYRPHVLGSLKRMYRVVMRRRGVARRHTNAITADEADRIHLIREWDERVVAPRHGYASALDYYAKASAGPILSQIRVPTLISYARQDPMVPVETLTDALRGRSAQVETWEVPRGGHIGFPVGQQFEGGTTTGRPSVDAELIDWLLADRA